MARGEGESGAQTEAEGNGRADANPDVAGKGCIAGPNEIGEQDRDDERGFKALAQGDQQGAQHPVSLR